MPTTEHVETRPSANTSSGLVFALAGLSGLLIAFAMVRSFFAPFGHDQAWGVYMADLWTHGAVIGGPTLYEVNPPYLVWFMAMPLGLSHLFHLSEAHGVALFFSLLFIVCLAWSVSLLQRRYPGAYVLHALFTIGLTFGAMCWMAREDIGERDHFAALMMVPYILYALFRLDDKRVSSAEQFALGLLTAAGACLKPQYILLPFLLEGYLLLRLRRRFLSVATAGFACGMVLYAIATYFGGTAYFHNVVPMIRAAYYHSQITWHNVYKAARRQVVFTVCNLLLCLVCWRRARYRELLTLFLGATATGLFLYLYQKKGFTYHSAPMIEFGAVALAIILAGILSGSVLSADPRSKAPWMTALAAAAAGILILPHVLHANQQPDYWLQKGKAAEVFARYPAGTAVQVISITPYEFPSIVEQHKVNGSRFMHIWWSDAALSEGQPSNPIAPSGKTRLNGSPLLGPVVRHDMGEDLQHFRPAVIIVDRTEWPLEGDQSDDHLLRWLSTDPLFQQEWQHYRRQERDARFDVFVRTPEQH